MAGPLSDCFDWVKMQLLSLCGNTHRCLSRSVLDIHWGVPLDKQPAVTTNLDAMVAKYQYEISLLTPLPQGNCFKGKSRNKSMHLSGRIYKHAKGSCLLDDRQKLREHRVLFTIANSNGLHWCIGLSPSLVIPDAWA